MKILTVGGGGFIGSHLARELSAHEVIAVDSLMVNNIYAEEHFGELHSRILRDRIANFAGQLIIADARNYNILSPICKAAKPDVIIHLAAISHQGKAQKNPHTTFDHSLRTLENALDIAVNLKVKRFVYFSSSTVYGDWPESGIVNEDTPCSPKGIYGSLKLAGELLVKAYSQAYGLEYTIIRPSALYGPGCVSGRVIQQFIERASAGLNLTATGEALDFTCVDDLVRGVNLAIMSDRAINQTYNLTYGHARRVSNAAMTVAKHYGVEFKVAERDQTFADRGTLCINRAKRDLGYDPVWPLEAGVQKYIEWFDGF